MMFDVPTVSVADLDGQPPGTVLLDVRELEEWAAGHAADAIHVPLSELPAGLVDSGALDGSGRIVVVCRVGARSAQVAAWLADQGHDAVNLAGGMEAWARAGRPIVGPAGTAGVII
jgi:rhodanese-related sulfurtransferase